MTLSPPEALATATGIYYRSWYVPATIALLLAVSPLGTWAFARAGRVMDVLAQRPRLAIALTGMLSLTVMLCLLALVGVPVPYISDEFSYLLAADTFAHGRLTNPTPALWHSFESYNDFLIPTYMSKYPPAQGVILAFGQVLTGLPILGVILSLALACSAICWMMMAWVPLNWAIGGSALAAIYSQTLRWGGTYWGGQASLLGGALVFGALGYSLKKPTVRNSSLLGLGLVILSFSRPIEGAVFGLFAGGVFLSARFGGGTRVKTQWGKALVLPLAIAGGVILVANGYYNQRLTGDVFTMPYVNHFKQYGMAPPLVFQSPAPEPVFRNRVFKEFTRGFDISYYNRQRTFSGYVDELLTKKADILGDEFLQPGLLLILLFSALFLIRDKFTRKVFWAASGATAAIVLSEQTHQPHYIAPFYAVYFTALTAGARRLSEWRWDRFALGKWVVRTVIISTVAASFFWVSALWSVKQGTVYPGFSPDLIATLDQEKPIWICMGIARDRVMSQWESSGRTRVAFDRSMELDDCWMDLRVKINSDLEKGPPALVVVRYLPGHFSADYRVCYDWVFNGADIGGARVVWARELDNESENRDLLKYYKERKIYLLKVDDTSVELLPYPQSTPS